MLSIGILLFDGVYIESVSTLYQVFSAANRTQLAADARRPRIQCFLIAQQMRPVQAAEGIKLLPDCVLFPSAELDVLVVADGNTSHLHHNTTLLTWLRNQATGALIAAGIGEGASVLAAAIQERDDATRDSRLKALHWFRRAQSHDNVLLQNSKKMMAAKRGGAAALSLQLLARLAEPQLAELTATQLQLEWKPHGSHQLNQPADSRVFSAA